MVINTVSLKLFGYNFQDIFLYTQEIWDKNVGFISYKTCKLTLFDCAKKNAESKL